MSFTIGKLAEQLGLEVQTIRYYEGLGLLPEPKRSSSGYRQYSEEYTSHLKFIHNLQELGFTLNEIKNLVDVKFNNKALGKDIKNIVQEKLVETNLEIDELKSKRDRLQALLASCSGKMKVCNCPIVESLSA